MVETLSSSPWYAVDGRTSWEEMLQQTEYFAGTPLMQRLLDTVPEIILVVNPQGQIVFANKELQTWLDLDDKKAVYGQRPGYALNCTYAFESDSGCGTREECRTCGAGQAIMTSLRGQEATRECRITRRDGNALDFRVCASPLVVNGQPFSAFTLQDIGHEKRRQALERIFFHDMINVASALSLASLLLTDTVTPEQLHKLQTIIHQVSTRLVDVIQSQRDLSRAEAGELTPNFAPLSAIQLLQSVQSCYENHEVAEGRTIRLAPDAQDAILVSDRTLLERVLGNLIKNALEASGEGQTVTISCGAKGSRVWFEVHNPTAMPYEVRLQVFHRSFSTKGEGRGLGTYSIKLLTERYLNGTVSFTSSPQQGTTFRVSYPVD
jgi:signal transduction histidine kinase